MDEWEVVSKELEPLEAVINPLVGGRTPYIYTVRCIETGETRKVIAVDDNDLGEKIANGDFYD